jgi:hypothetical protein
MARGSLLPAPLAMSAPSRSVTPVAFSPADITNTAATMIAGSLANPASASAGVRMPVKPSARSASIAAMSMRTRSLMNKASVPARITKKTICEFCIRAVAAIVVPSLPAALAMRQCPRSATTEPKLRDTVGLGTDGGDE